MQKIRLGLYEIKKRITVSRISLILLISMILFLYSLSFNGALDFIADNTLYSLLREYEVSTGDRTGLLDNDAEENLYEFYKSDDYATLKINSLFYRIQNMFEDYNDAETLQHVFATDSIFTASILVSFHESMFWLTAASSILIALLCFFLGLKERPEKTEYFNTCLYGKDSSRNRHSAVLISSTVVVLTGSILAFAYFLHRTGTPEVLTEPIYSRYAPQLAYRSGNMPFAGYCFLALVVYSLFSFACAMLDFQIAELFGGNVKSVLLVPIEVVFQIFISKKIWLCSLALDWKVGGGRGGLFNGFSINSFSTINYAIIIPLIMVGLLLLLAGNLLTMKYKRTVKAAR